MNRLAKPDFRLMAIITAFWLVFWAFYPYHFLIDDSRYQSILQHKFMFIDTMMRPFHSWLLYIVGDLSNGSMKAAVFTALLFHLGIGAVANWSLIPRMPESMQLPARLGLIGFLLHPVALQTVVHVAQGSEILGAFFSVIVLSMAMRFFPDSRLTGRAAPKPRIPSAADFTWMAVFAAAAMLSKENYLPPLILTIAATAWSHRSRAGRNAVLLLIPLLAIGALSNRFSHELIQNQTNYERSRIFRSAVENGQEAAPKDSIILPLRDRRDNFVLQTALIPLILRATLFPFGLVQDYGHFPYGKKTYSTTLPWLWFGLAIELLILAALIIFRKKISPTAWAFLLSPLAYYIVYFVFPVYDPLFLYRLYGLVFFTFVIAIPAFTQVVRGAAAARWDRPVLVFSAVVAFLATTGGIVRAYEMHDSVLETSLELKRLPENYRLHVYHLHALVDAKMFPIDCSALMQPALTLAPSAALIHVEWAWCHSVQRQIEQTRKHALLSLESESVPENVHAALNMMMTPEGISFDPKKVHPANLPILFGNQK